MKTFNLELTRSQLWCMGMFLYDCKEDGILEDKLCNEVADKFHELMNSDNGEDLEES
jgi:hypothetical protein